LKFAADVVRSATDSIYDLLKWSGPPVGVAHDGMKFSTPDVDNDVLGTINCAALLGGSFWNNKCGIFIPTINTPSWYSRGQSGWQAMKIIHMMVKLQ